MKISTKGRYGLRAMIDLAANSHGEHVPLNSIAQRQNVSENYLEQVFSALRKAGLVKSIKGAQGGYILGDRSSNITIGDILRVLEGDLSVVDQSEKSNNPGNSMEYCLSVSVWEKIDEGIRSVVDSTTLEDLAAQYKSLNTNTEPMYYI